MTDSTARNERNASFDLIVFKKVLLPSWITCGKPGLVNSDLFIGIGSLNFNRHKRGGGRGHLRVRMIQPIQEL